MKKSVLSLSVLMIVTTIFVAGCKKGEDDPFISFRSRNARLVGTWMLISSRTTYNETTTTSRTNDVNTNYATSEFKASNTTSTSGNTKSVNTYTSTKNETKTTAWDPAESKFVENINSVDFSDDVTTYYTTTIELEIKKDYTYTATFNETIKSRSMIHTEVEADGTVTTTQVDTVYNPANTQSWTEVGEWNWVDSNDDKIIINAGPMQGSMSRLSNKEISISGEANESDSRTEYTAVTLPTYDDVDNPWNEEDGIETEIMNEKVTETYSQEWEAK